MPVKIAKAKAKTTLNVDWTIVVPKEEINGIKIKLNKTPIIPPKRLIKFASKRNCSKMSFFELPKAFNKPIYLVRSLTVTNKTFIMPIPPTIKTIEATAMSIKDKVSADF